jgi:hypothetical protein
MTTHRMLLRLALADAFPTEADARAELLAKQPGPLGAYRGVWFAPHGGAVHLFTDMPLSELAAAGWTRHGDADDFDNWIRTVLDQIEGVARAGSPGPWVAITSNGRKDGIGVVGQTSKRGTGEAVAVFAGPDTKVRNADAQHVALWSPQFVIGVIESAHAILAEHSRYPSTSGRPVCDTCRDPASPETAARYPCPTVRNVAHPFRRLPGYRQGWAP